MRILLLLFFVLTFFSGFGILANAKSAIHEIEAFLLFLISTVLFAANVIVETIVQSKKKFEVLIQTEASIASNTLETVRVLREQLASSSAQAKASSPPLVGTRKPVGKTYHYSSEDGQMGPYTLQDMRDFRDASVVEDKTLIFKEGDTEWRAFSHFSEFHTRA